MPYSKRWIHNNNDVMSFPCQIWLVVVTSFPGSLCTVNGCLTQQWSLLLQRSTRLLVYFLQCYDRAGWKLVSVYGANATNASHRNLPRTKVAVSVSWSVFTRCSSPRENALLRCDCAPTRMSIERQ